MSSDPSSRNNPGLSQGGHPSSYNPNRPGLTSEISGELTAYAIRHICGAFFPGAISPGAITSGAIFSDSSEGSHNMSAIPF